MAEVKEDVFKGVDFGEFITTGLDSGVSSDTPVREEDLLQHAPIIKEKTVPKEGAKKNTKELDVVDLENGELEDESLKEKKNPSHDDSQSDNADSSIALVFAKFQNERGTLSSFDEAAFAEMVKEEGDEVALEYLYDNEVEARVAEFKKMYEADIQEYIDLKDVGVDANTAKKLVASKSAFDAITVDQLEDEDAVELRTKVLTQNFKNNTSLPDDEIAELVENLITAGKDIEKAKQALPKIKQFNEEQIKVEKQAKINARQAEENASKAKATKLKETIYSSKEILGQSVNKVTQQKLEKFLFEPIGNDGNGNPIDGISAWFQKNPEQARVNLAYAIMTGILDGKMDTIKSKEKSNVLKELQNKMQNKGQGLDGFSEEGSSGSTTLSSLKKSFNIQ